MLKNKKVNLKLNHNQINNQFISFLINQKKLEMKEYSFNLMRENMKALNKNFILVWLSNNLLNSQKNYFNSSIPKNGKIFKINYNYLNLKKCQLRPSSILSILFLLTDNLLNMSNGFHKKVDFLPFSLINFQE